MNARLEIIMECLEVSLMNKINTIIWGRKFELDVIIKVFENSSITKEQNNAINEFSKINDFNDSLDSVKQYVLNNGGIENGIKNIDNIFKYVMPKCIYVPKTNKRTVAIMCDYKFDPEHGIAVVYEDEKYNSVGEEGIVL